MNFFGSLQQYVTSGVAGLGLSPRRFSLSRQESHDLSQQGTLQQQASMTGHNPQITPTDKMGSSGPGSLTQTQHGFPKVLPAPGTVVGTSPTSGMVGIQRQDTQSQQIPQSPQSGSRRQSRNLECLVPPRTGSFRQRNSPVHQATAPAPLAFCKRRLSWPEVDPKATSGIQETDGSYFETFTSLAWKRENRRLSSMRAAEARAEIIPDNEREPTADEEPHQQQVQHPEHKEQLYVDVLYTIANMVGQPGSQYPHYKEEMYLQAQRAFGVSPDRHYRFLHTAAEEKPKIVVLSVIVYEAEGLEAKDANGFSDPYCMLGIQPGGPPVSPLPPPLTPRALSEAGLENNCGNSLDVAGNDKLRKHHSFRLSFKRKDGSRREQRDSLGGPVPAKFIRATSIKPHTLCPKWNEKFKFDIDDLNSDTFHLDIWDHDDESCVLDAVSRLNEVRGVRGLGRFFKQVCQSARQGSQDDFLGSINIPICDIPSTGLEGWFKLEARSQRSNVQGRIRLRMWLSTREGTSEEDNFNEVKKLEKLQTVFMAHERDKHEPSWTWSGDLPGPSLTILHQMAIQADLSDLHCALARYVAAVRLNQTAPMDPKFVHRLLSDVDRLWNQPNQEMLTREEEQWLACAIGRFIDKSLDQVRRHREIFPALHPPSLVRLEFLLRSMGLLSTMKAFRQVCPFNKGIRGEIVSSLRRGSVSWAQHALREAQRTNNCLVLFTSTLLSDLQLGLTYYHNIFDNTNGIQYFSIIYKQFDAIIAEEVRMRMETGQIPGASSLSHWTVLEGDKEPVDIRPFELYLVLQEFSILKQHLSIMPQPPEKQLALQQYHEWFEAVVQRWISVTKARALNRVRAAIQLDNIIEGEHLVRHSTSSIDLASCLYQIREFWKLLAWPEHISGAHFEAQLIEAACAAATHYGDLIHQTLADSGYYEQTGPFRTSDEMCITVNNLEYVRRSLSEFRTDGGSLLEGAEALLESSLSNIEARAERILAKLGVLMQGPLQKTVFHLAWSPDSLPTNQAIVPLLEYLDLHLSALNAALLTKNFNRALTIIWNTVLSQLSHQMDTGIDTEKPRNFHDRLYEALQLLVEFFNAEGQGLGMDVLRGQEFYRVEQRLQYHKTDTERLMDLFYLQRLQDQIITMQQGTLSPYGSLAVRAYFNHDSLCVEILHARDIIPLDPNGFSDPFVILEILPRRVFPHCSEQQTNVHKKTLNPVFDECFEFSVSLEQCQMEGAMICFTVMDHDVLTANDFAGEAFLALANIPGVADYSTSVENFHGLKHADLPLMQQHEKNNAILQILESRVGDKQAVEFVRKQKARLAS